MLAKRFALLSVVLAVICVCHGAQTAYGVDAVKNFTKSTVAQGYNEVSTVINLETGAGARMPAPPFRLAWWDCTGAQTAEDDPDREIILVSGVATDTLTITRGYEGTLATSHNTPGKTYCVVQPFTAGMYGDFLAEIRAGAGGAQDILNVVAVDLRTGLDSALADIGSSQKVLRLTDTRIATTNKSFPETMTVWIESAGRLSWDDGVFLDFDRPEQIKAGPYQIFDAKAGVRFAKPGVVDPAWWGFREGATSTQNQAALRQAVDAMVAGSTRVNVLKLGVGTVQIDDLILTNNRNVVVRGSGETVTILQFAAVGAGKHGFSCSGVTKYLRLEDLTIRTTSALSLDNAQAAINCDIATATLDSGTIVEGERVTIDGWNRGVSCDGGNSFLIARCGLRHGSVTLSGINSTSLNYAFVCTRVSLCIGEYVSYDGASKGAHALLATSATTILFQHNTAKNFGAQAIVAMMKADDGSHPNPRSWNLESNDLTNNGGSVSVQLSQGYELPLVSLAHITIDGDSGSGAGNTAILIDLAGTSKLRTILAHGLTAKNLAKRVLTFNGVSGTTLDRVEAFGLNFVNWSTGSSTTYAAIDTNSTGTKLNFVYSGTFNGSSNGRSVLGASFETYWSSPPQALQVYDTGSSVASDNRFKVPVGASTSRASVGGTLYTKTTQTNTAANTTETTLDTVSISANSFNANKNGFHIHMAGVFAGNTNTKTLRIKFNGVTVITNDKTPSPNGVSWVVNLYVAYSGTNQQVISATMQVDCVNQSPVVTTANADTTTGLAVLATGQNGSASNNDIRHNMTIATYIP